MDKKSNRAQGGKEPETRDQKKWNFRLYVANESIRSINAIENMRTICRERLKGDCHIDIVDLVKHPEIAIREQILAVPTLVYMRPTHPHNMTFIGDLTSERKVLEVLGILNAR